nr:hypothetical protein [Pseudomonas syringae]
MPAGDRQWHRGQRRHHRWRSPRADLRPGGQGHLERRFG